MQPDPNSAPQDGKPPQSATPWSVWLFYLYCVSFQVSFAGRAFSSLLPYAERIDLYASVGAWMLQFAGRMALLALPLLLIVLVHRRGQRGRWLGILAIGASLVVLLIHLTDPATPAPTLYDQVILPGLVILWVYRFGFSARSKLYFAPPRGP